THDALLQRFFFRANHIEFIPMQEASPMLIPDFFSKSEEFVAEQVDIEQLEKTQGTVQRCF
ncbi:MAG: hypothetical protein VW543_18735, partial [Deltaproteobacteria bacterium]